MKCKGILGRIFGHNYKSMTSEYIPTDGTISSSGVEGVENMNKIINSNARKNYKIVCTRCGDEK